MLKFYLQKVGKRPFVWVSLLVALVLTTGSLHAQSVNSVSGRVSDADGMPLAGVTVIVKGTRTGTVTNSSGEFEIRTNDLKNAVLSFSFLGYTTVEKQVPPGVTRLDIALDDNTTMIDEVVAIGYGTQTKRSITSAVTSIKADDLSGFVGSSIEQSLAGLVPGVRILASDATPGGDMNIEVRGVGTVTAGASPLFIVDGIPIEDGLLTVNPDDVESIQILKDAASTAVYGSRGANGVFLITTKRGMMGRTNVNVNISTTFAQAQRQFEVMNTDQLLEYLDDSGINRRYYYLTNETQDYFPFDANLNTNWQDAIFRTVVQQKYSVSVSGGIENADGSRGVSYRVSGEYFDQPGVVIYTGMQRYAFRGNFDIKMSKWARVGVNFSTSSTRDRKTREGGEGSNSVIRTAISMYPFFPVYLPNGDFFTTLDYRFAPDNNSLASGPNPETGEFDVLQKSPLADNQDNPIRIARDYKNITNNMRTTGGLNFTFDIAKGLTFKPSLSVDMYSKDKYEWYPASIGKNRTDSEAYHGQSKRLMWLSENILNYERSFGRHNLGVMAGVTFQKIDIKELSATANRFTTESLPNLGGGTVDDGDYTHTDDRMLSFVSRISYNYAQKYILQATFRRDGSTKFGKNNLYGNFPSVSAGWVISEEPFMKALPFISELKIRGSWGISGNNNIGFYNYENKLGQNNYIIDGEPVIGWAPSNLGNNDIRWEKSVQTNLGIDLGLFKNRIYMQLDLYRSKTKDMLLSAKVPSSLGQTTMLRNIGSVQNEGIEFNIVSRNLTGRFKWTTTFNISANRNKVLSLSTFGEEIYAGISESHITKVGYPIGMFYGRVFGGIYQSMEQTEALRNDPYSGLAFDPNVRPGDCMWYDLNGDGTYDDSDKAIIGNPYPKFTAGMVNTFRYANFTLSVQLNASYGNQIYNYALHQFLRGTDSNKSILVADRWRSEDSPGNGIADRTTTTNDVKPSAEKNKFSNRLLEDGSYLSIRNVQLAYTFPRELLRKIRLEGLTLSFNIDNLYTFTKYTGLNPESSSVRTSTSPGIDRMGYPVSRNYTVGIKFNF